MAVVRSTVTQSAPPPEPEIFTYAEAALILRRSRSWLEKQVAAQAVPHRQIGARGVGFTREDIDHILEASYRPPVRRPIA